jgi:dolichyl-phosphate-mannose--protein O-mannosyl transferase
MVLLVFIWMKENKKYTIVYFALLGIFSGLAISVKANSLIVVLLPISWLWFEKKYIVNLENIKEVVGRFFAYGFGIVVIVFAVFYMHFSLGKKIEDNRKYGISSEYLSFIENNQTSNILNFSIMLRDNLKFMNNYQKGVPKLDLCKVGENGSLAIGWPLGIKSINYRWLKKDGKVEYTYLQGNPIIWLSVFCGILLSFSLIVSKYIFRYTVKNERLFEYILLFTVLYLSYMIAVLQIDRVMYMYHYFMALVFGMFNLAFMIFYLFKEYIDTNNVKIFMGIGLFVAVVVWIFFQFSPLTYSIPIDTKQFESLQWFDFWKLTVIK